MSTEGRVCGRTAPTQKALPVDLLLEIFALADAVTVVRSAATGRILRRAILEPAFRRRLAANDGFDPALLIGASYQEHVYHRFVTAQRVVHTPRPTNLRARLDDHSLLDSFKPVASRDGLLVLRRHGGLPDDKVELRALDISTGHATSLPPTTLPNACLHVVLSVGDAGRSFELLAADMNNKQFYRTFTSKDRQWSAIRELSVPLPYKIHPWDSNRSAVISRTVYLPCRVNACHRGHVLALDVDSGEATMMELPKACFSRMMAHNRDERLLLAPVRGRLCVLVAECRRIAMLTLTSSVPATWSRQVVVSNVGITRQAGLHGSSTLVSVRLVGFGQRSGAVILNWETRREMLFLRLDLGPPIVVTRLGSPGSAGLYSRFFLHEIDLDSLLQAMKSF